MTKTGSAGPLAGVRVLDFSRVLAGPHCARAFADLGADVIKLEPPEGDLARSFGPRHGHMGLYYLQQNAGKRNVSLNLRTEEGRRLATDLALRCDVLLENFRPGVMARYGLDYATLSARKPQLVYVSISGYGQTGASRGRAAYAPAIHAEAGLTEIHARRFGEQEPFEASSHADLYAGLHALSGALAALLQRERTGRGQHVDVAMAASLLNANDRASIEAETTHPPAEDSALVYLKTPDGRRLVICGEPTNAAVFESYVRLLDRPGLRTDPRFATRRDRQANRDALLAEIQAWAERVGDAEQIERLLDAERLPLGVVRPIREIAESTWAAERGAFADVDDRTGGTVRVPQRPWRFSDADVDVSGTAAWRGEHNAAVLGELLELTAEDLSVLQAQGVVSSRLPAEPTDQEAAV